MPNPELRIPEKAALLALMTFVDKVSNRDLRDRYGFAIDGQVRTKLQGLGLLTGERAADLPGRPYVLELTEQGWRWCREELGAAVPEGAPRAYRLMYGLLNVLDRHVQRSDCAMADVFTAVDAKPAEDRIRAAYASLTGEPGAWIRLSRLRDHLADLPRGEVDAALRRLDRQADVLLDPEINRKTLSDADRAAAVRIGGDDKHLLAIERS